MRTIIQQAHVRAPEKKSGALRPELPQAGFLLAVVLLAACSSDETGGDRRSTKIENHPPVVKSAMILPAPAVLSGPLTVSVDGQDIDGQNIQYRYRWLVNGEVAVGQTAVSLSPGLLKQGDHVAVEVTPFDGIIEGSPFLSTAVSVVNTAPIIAHLSVEYDLAAQARRIMAHAEVIDPDHDAITVTYRWTQHDKVVKEGEDNFVEVVGLTARDPVQVEVMVTDGHHDATTRKGQFLIGNSLPTIISRPPSAPKSGQYEYRVQATDSDDDPLTYALEAAPPGMRIDAQTGEINWVPSPDIKGTYKVRIIAQDPKGGFASQEFDLTLTPPPKSSSG